MEGIYLVKESTGCGYEDSYEHYIATFENKEDAIRYCYHCIAKAKQDAKMGEEFMLFSAPYEDDDDAAERDFIKLKGITSEDLWDMVYAYYNDRQYHVEWLKFGCPCSCSLVRIEIKD